MRMLSIKPDGSLIEHVTSDDESSLLVVMQGIVGGFIEYLRLPRPGLAAYVNEEGYLHALPPNPIGTRVLRALGWQGMAMGGAVSGTVLFVGADGSAEVPLTFDQISELIDLATDEDDE